MSDAVQLRMKHLDEGQQARRRISALSNLLMACGDEDPLPVDDLQEIAYLIQEEANKLGACMNYLAQCSESL